MTTITGQRHRAVVVYRRTELDELTARHATRGQLEFFLASRGRSLGDVQQRHDKFVDARRHLIDGIPEDWAIAEVEREDVSRFLFAPEDIVVAFGQDGLVANVAKYLTGQLVIGVNPEGSAKGPLVRHDVKDGLTLLLRPETAVVAQLTTVAVHTDAGDVLTGLNEVFVGQPSHQSARYVIETPSGCERQSSSGLIVGTGAGSTGWCASLAHDRAISKLPGLTDASLVWFVREAWPSPTTSVQLTAGLLTPGETLRMRVESDELVAFADGIETDHLTAVWGQQLTIGTADTPVRIAL